MKLFLSTKIFKSVIFLGIIFFFFFISTATTEAANFYWVGSAGGNISAKANWSTAAGACSGAGNASAAPGAADVAYFVSNCVNDATIDSVNWSILGISIGSGYSGTTTLASGKTLTIGTSNYTQADGVMNAVAGTVTINGTNFTLSGGTFIAPSGTFTYGGGTGTFTKGATAIFTHSSGTFVYNATGGYKIFNLNSSTLSLNNFTFSNGSILLNTGGVISMAGNTILTNGTIDAVAGSSEGYFDVYGNLTIASTWDGAGGNGPGRVRLRGGNDQTVSSSAALKANFYVNKTGGVATSTGTFTTCNFRLDAGSFVASGALATFSCNGTYPGTFYISSGTFDAPSGTLSLNNSFTINGGTFNHNNGTVSLLTSAGIISLASNLTLYNLTLSQSAGWYNITTGITVSVLNNLAFNDGLWHNNSNTGIISAFGNISVGANWDGCYQDNVTYCLNLYISSTTATQTFTSSGAFNNNVVLNSASNNLQLANAATFRRLTITNGTFDSNGQNLTLRGGLNLTAGTFIAPTGSLTLNFFSGDATFTLGASAIYTHSSGTVSISGYGIFFSLGADLTLWNLTFAATLADPNQSWYKITTGRTISALNNLVFNGGRWHNNTNTGTIIAYGNVSVGAGWDGCYQDNVNYCLTLTIGSTTATQTFTAAADFDNRVVFANTGQTANLSGATTFMTLVINTNATFNINGSNLTVTSTFTNNGTLGLQGGETVSTPTLGSGSTVYYDGTAVTYNIKTWTYKNLTIAGGNGSVFSLATTTTGLTTSTITNSTLNLNGYNFTTTTLVNDGKFRLKGTETVTITNPDTDSGTVEYYGAGVDQNITIKDFGATDYYNLSINDINLTKATFLGVSKVIANNLIVGGGTFAPSTAITIGGSIINTGGLIDASTTAMTLNGTNQSISLVATTTVASFTKSVSSADNLTFKNMEYPLAVTGTSTLAGASGDLLSLLSLGTSTNFIRLNSGNPVLGLGAAGKFDATHAYTPSVIKDGSTYKMWYGGYLSPSYTIGYATSPDGITWTKQNSGNAVLATTTGKFDATHVYMPSVIKDGDIYRMWYTGYASPSYTIGYATSSDGITWTKQNSGNAVLGLGAAGKFDDTHAYYPFVLKDGSTYKMWYGGNDGANVRIGYATSADGISWTKQNSGNAVLDLGAIGEFDVLHAQTPSVVKDGDVYKMWYSAQGGSNNVIAHATSSDGISWNKVSNPVLGIGASGSADAVHSYFPSVLLDDDGSFKMWYSGHNGTNVTIGLAQMSTSTQWQFDPQATTTGRVFSYLDVKDSWNINAESIDSTAITGFVDSGNNTGWGASVPVNAIVTVADIGRQLATTTTPDININLGGAFTFLSTGGDVEITDINIKQNGSVATSSFENITLHYKAEETCSTTTMPAGTDTFGIAGEFNASSTATVSGTLSLSADTQVCMYITYDLNGEYSTSTMGRSIDLEITNPSADITLTGGTVTTTTKVNVDGRTMIMDGSILSILSLHMRDPAKDPTVYYWQDYAVWKMEGGGTPRRMFNPNLKVHDLTFTDLTGPNSGGVVRISITVSNVDIDAPDSFINVTKTYRTTGAVRVWTGSD